MTENAKKACYALLRERDNGLEEADIFYIAYATSLPCDKAIEAMDEIISLGGAERLDIKRYKLYDIRAVLTEPEEEPPAASPSEAAYDRSKIQKIISDAEARQMRAPQTESGIEDDLKNYEDFLKMRQKRDEALAKIRPEEKRAALTLIAAIEKIKQERLKEALYYPSGRFAHRFAECARQNIIWDKKGGDIYVYVQGLYYSTGEQVKFRLVSYGRTAYLGDDRFLVRKIAKMKGMMTAEAEKRLKLLVKNPDIGVSVFEVKSPATDKTAFADICRLYNFIQSVLDALI
ncbi:MAG: hypothetical protein K2N30_01900 [Clostridia bacterium]|nr:hypothetical protein [Clostridia bacterium]